MKFIRVISVLVLLCSWHISVMGQSNYQRKQLYQQHRVIKDIPRTLQASSFFESYQQQLGLDDHTQMFLYSSEQAPNGVWHYTFKQEYNGVPVFGCSYKLHQKGDQLLSGNGSYLPHINMDIKPELNPDEAIHLAMVDFEASTYPWELNDANDKLKSAVPNDYPDAELGIIDRAFPKISGDYVLVYKLDLYSVSPLSGHRYFVDAVKGEIITEVELIHGIGVPASCETLYYGTQELTIDSLSATEYVLQDPSRGENGITVVNFDRSSFISEDAEFDSQDDGYILGAMDALYCTTKFYDALRDEFDWLGIDNKNGSMNVGVYAQGNDDNVNAFWSGEMSWFGIGDCNYGPLTTMEVVGHEFMHGVIESSSDLIYSGEPGAINESICDVMGHYMEFVEDPARFSWMLGNSFATNEQAGPLRVMDDPTLVMHPGYYGGDFWRDGGNVHINSGIGNRWFTLVADGGTGVNEDQQSYEVESLGLVEMAKFVFHLNRYYLSENTDYQGYYEASVQAVEEYFNEDPFILENIEAAWAAVGLPLEEAEINLDLAIETGGFLTPCSEDKVIDLSCIVSNVGIVDYQPSMQGVVRVTTGFGIPELLMEVPLDQELLVGETKEFSFEDIIELERSLTSVQYEIVIADDYAVNNTDDQYISITNHVEKDLGVQIASQDRSCDSEEYELVFLLENKSCTIFPTGETVTLELTEALTGEMLWSETIVTEERIFPRSRIAFDRSMALDYEVSTSLRLEVFYADDPDATNNFANTTITPLNTIYSDYSNDFDSQDLENNISIVTNRPALPWQYNHENDNVFYAAGTNSSSDQVLCPESKDNFGGDISNPFNSVIAEISACVDLSDLNQPILNFDLAQFRNEIIDFPSDQTSVMRITWAGSEPGNIIIDGQPEGSKLSHQIELPENYAGSLKMRFVGYTGVASTSQSFLQYDVSLLDNLWFSQPVSTEDIATSHLSIFPNPVTNLLYLNKDLAGRIRIIDVQGREVAHFLHLDNEPIDIAHLSEGMYLIEIENGEGKFYTSKFIKQ